MATHDYVIANGTGAAVRSDLNGALAAIVSQNSNASAPATTYAYMSWADTSAGVMKMRNGANSAWISLYELDGTFLASDISLAAGSAAAPSLFFTGDTNTGIYSPGADTLALVTGGTNRVHVTSAGLVGLGTAGPGYLLDIQSTSATLRIRNTTAPTTGGTSSLLFEGINNFSGTSQSYINSIQAGNSGATQLAFGTSLSTDATATERLRITSAGLVGIGTTAPETSLHIKNSGDQILTVNSSSNGDACIFLGGQGAGKIGKVIGWDAIAFLTATNGTPANAGTERARIDSSGRLLVGTSSWSVGATAAFVGNSSSGTGNADVHLSRGLAATGMSSGQDVSVISFSDNAGGKFAQIGAQTDGTPGSGDYPGRLVFSTTPDGPGNSPTERMRINNTGSVTMQAATSVSSGSHSFQDNGSSPNTVRLYNSTDSNNTGNRFLICDAASSVLRAEIRTNGGLANYSANNANLSDRNAKKDISLAADTWGCVKEWEIVNYRYKDQPDDADLNLGVIAQQVAESCPEVITVFQEAKEATETEPAKEERLGVKEQQMYWMAIKALQEAMERIEALEADVAALKGA